jgi:hypothetical protein
MKKPKHKKPKKRRAPPPPPPAPPAQPPRSIRKVLGTRIGRLVSLLVFVLTVVGGVPPVLDAYEHTSPEIQRSEGAPESSVLSVTIKNKSSLFDMTDVELFCLITQATFEGAGSRSGIELIMEKSQIPGAVIRAGSQVSHTCDADRIIRSHMPFPGIADMKIASVCLIVGVEYRTLHLWQRTHRSQIFIRHRSADGFQWTEGPVFARPSADINCISGTVVPR